MIKEQIEKDLKKAMLAGDKASVSALRNIKSAIGYSEVAANKREEGLDDKELSSLLRKESKKRQEAADLYAKAGAEDRVRAELTEKKIIDQYLPKAMSEEETIKFVEEAIQEIGELTQKTMGQTIAATKRLSGDRADGALVARIVQQRLNG